MVWVSPLGGDLDPATGAVLDALVGAATTAPWVGAAVILLWRWRRSRGVRVVALPCSAALRGSLRSSPS